MGAYSLSTIMNVIGDIVAEMYGENIESLSASTSNSTEEPTPRNESVALKVKYVKNKLFGGSILIAFILFSSRSISNYINFGGKYLYYYLNLLHFLFHALFSCFFCYKNLSWTYDFTM